MINLNNLSRRFIYFNDDFSFQTPVCMSVFWTPEKGYKIYKDSSLGRKVLKKKCSEDCVTNKMGDGKCDQECYTLTCLWDDNDCDGIEPTGGSQGHREAYFQSLDFVSVLYEKTLKGKSERNKIPHIPLMCDIEIVKGHFYNKADTYVPNFYSWAMKFHFLTCCWESTA